MALSAGQKLNATGYNRDTQKLGNRGRRTTVSTGATSATNVGVEHTSGLACVSGYAYRIECPNLAPRSTVSGDILEALLRYTEDGSTPTTSSPLLVGSISRSPSLPGASTALGMQLVATYLPTSNTTLRVLLCISRLSGTGTVSLFADGSGLVTDILITNLGPDPGDTSTDV